MSHETEKPVLVSSEGGGRAGGGTWHLAECDWRRPCIQYAFALMITGPTLRAELITLS